MKDLIEQSKNVLEGEMQDLEESNKDKYMWGDINQALSSAGLNPRIVMSVLSKLKGKEVK